MPLAAQNQDRKCTDVRFVGLHNVPVIRDYTETHTLPREFHSVAIGNPFNFDGLLLVLRGCRRSAEATQGETNNHFITITPRGARRTRRKLLLMSHLYAEEDKPETHILYM